MNSQDFAFITNCMLNYTFCTQSTTLSHDELTHLCNVINYPSIEDRYLVDNPGLYPYIKWDRLGKMQSIRIVARNMELLKVIDLKKHQYRIREVFFLIKRNFDILFTHFNFDFENLSQDDAYFLLCLGQDKFLKMIDFSKYSFNFIETNDIIKAYECRRDVIMSLNYKELKSYQVAEILIMTGKEFLDLFDLDILTTLDWLKVLMYQPNFINRCDFNKFIEGDPFNLIQLIVLFEKPDLSYLIEKIDLDDITPFGWERLLIGKTEKFKNLCRFEKLKENNWSVIAAENPELLIYKQ